jgi:hypothetical protein
MGKIGGSCGLQSGRKRNFGDREKVGFTFLQATKTLRESRDLALLCF